MVALYAVRPVSTLATDATGTDFRTGYAVAVAEFRQQTQDLKHQGEQVSGAGTDEVLAVYSRLRVVTQDAADRFAALTPPGELKGDFATFTTLLRQQVAALDRVVRDARSGSARSLAADLQRYAALVADWLTLRPRLEGGRVRTS